MSGGIVKDFLCNSVSGYFCAETREKISANGYPLSEGDMVMVFTPSTNPDDDTPGIKVMAATGKDCPCADEMNFESADGDVCLDPGSVFYFSFDPFKALQEGKTQVRPEVTLSSTKESD